MLQVSTNARYVREIKHPDAIRLSAQALEM